MKQNVNLEPLHLFGAEAEGETLQVSAPTPQTEETGDDREKGTPAAGECAESEAREKGFRAMMEGEYKDLFTAYFQETFNRRFKEQKEMKAELERANLLLDEAAAYLGVERGALREAMRAEREKKIATPERVAEDCNGAAQQPTLDEAVRAAREETERAVLASIRARGVRPAECALSGGSGDALRGGQGRMSRAQRAEVARRAAKGERIKF